jgi:phosphoribosyl-ATP pyrophosphohydrolase
VPDLVNDVRKFMIGAGQLADGQPLGFDDEVFQLRKDLIIEEYHETINAFLDRDIIEVADGLADMVYVILGTALAFGIDFDAVWAEVQRANMQKITDGVRSPEGKIMKGPNYVAPNIAKALGLDCVCGGIKTISLHLGDGQSHPCARCEFCGRARCDGK